VQAHLTQAVTSLGRLSILVIFGKILPTPSSVGRDKMQKKLLFLKFAKKLARQVSQRKTKSETVQFLPEILAHFSRKSVRRNNYLFESWLIAHKTNKRSQGPMASVISACWSFSNGV
jgi:hypothetical protein